MIAIYGDALFTTLPIIVTEEEEKGEEEEKKEEQEEEEEEEVQEEQEQDVQEQEAMFWFDIGFDFLSRKAHVHVCVTLVDGYTTQYDSVYRFRTDMTISLVCNR